LALERSAIRLTISTDTPCIAASSFQNSCEWLMPGTTLAGDNAALLDFNE
jgi:hypothetical protein